MSSVKDKQPVQTVIADYKYSIIMDMYPDPEIKEWQCNITRFEHSLNTIETIMNEMWKPRADSYTVYYGE